MEVIEAKSQHLRAAVVPKVRAAPGTQRDPLTPARPPDNENSRLETAYFFEFYLVPTKFSYKFPPTAVIQNFNLLR
jgi:hypothetical protein